MRIIGHAVVNRLLVAISKHGLRHTSIAIVGVTLTLVALTLVTLLMPLRSERAFAQAPNCQPIVDQLRAAVASCSRLNRNSACYGSAPAFVSPFDIDFDAPGEQELISALEAIETNPAAGAVLMLLHLDTAESPVKVVVFGGAELTPLAGAGDFFTLESGGAELCPLSPAGMVVRTEPEDAGTLTVNGVTIILGSAAYIALSGADTMIIANLEGQVAVSIDGVRQEIPVAYQSLVVGISTGQPVFQGQPTPSPLYNSEVGRFLGTDIGGLKQVTEVSDESNEVTACGGRLTLGQTSIGRITSPGQECVYTFCSLEGRALSVNLERVNGAADPLVSLYRPDGALFKYNDDISDENINSRICTPALPTVGCYSITARFENNATGLFRISVSEPTACASLVPRCQVVALALNQRAGPSLDAPIIRTLPRGTQLRPLEGTADRQWVRATVAGTSLEGWVNTSVELLACEDVIPGPNIATPTPGPLTPTPETPTPASDPKAGPFPGP